MAINYLRRVQAINRNQGQSDVERGIASGEAIGKLLGNLGTAIQGAQKNALANKLMNTQDAPRAALVSAPGSGGDSGGPQPGPPDQGNTVDSNADLSTDLPEDVSNQLSTTTPTQTFYNPSSQSIEPLQGQAPPTTYSGTNTDPLVASNVAAAKLSTPSSTAAPNQISATDWSKQNPNVSIFGTQQHTGGVQEMELQKEMLAMQMQKAQLAKANAPPQAPDPLDVAYKQVRLAQARKDLLEPDQKTAVDKTSLASNMDTEPVGDQDQLVRTYESTHGKGSFDRAVSAFNAPDSVTVPDPKDSNKTVTVPNIPKVVGNSVILNPNSEKNSVTLQLGEAQTLAKQLNTRRITQGLAPIPVPGMDQTLGSTRANPIDVKTRLDGASIPRGKWIRTPTGAIIQRP